MTNYLMLSQILEDLVLRLGPKPRYGQAVHFEVVRPPNPSAAGWREDGSAAGSDDAAATPAHVHDQVFITQSAGAVVVREAAAGALTPEEGGRGRGGAASGTLGSGTVGPPLLASSADFSQARGARRLGTKQCHAAAAAGGSHSEAGSPLGQRQRSLPPIGPGHVGSSSQQQQVPAAAGGGSSSSQQAGAFAMLRLPSQDVAAASAELLRSTSGCPGEPVALGPAAGAHQNPRPPAARKHKQHADPAAAAASGSGALAPSYSELFTQMRDLRGRLLVSGAGATAAPPLLGTSHQQRRQMQLSGGGLLASTAPIDDAAVAGWSCASPPTSGSAGGRGLLPAPPSPAAVTGRLLLTGSSRGHHRAGGGRL
jgi:hypothetical protein